MIESALIHEVWEELDGSVSVCLAGPAGDTARDLLSDGARLLRVFEASSHFEAMTRFHEIMEREPYASSEAWDFEPYPAEWVQTQRAALLATIGTREAIASSAAARAWKAAASDLGIRVVSPFELHHGEMVYWCAAWLPDFGSVKGAVIASRLCLDEVFDSAEAEGMFASGLSPYFYETYDRNLFAETLNDWGWFGDPALAPPWFGGALRRHGGRGSDTSSGG